VLLVGEAVYVVEVAPDMAASEEHVELEPEYHW
jgi:hypothetical protein